ncbi:MAG: sugar phosphate isomerase/epimerase [Promethearchaeota archaeon]|nr:MAG: sugar phosphate isomerase/epimerase [Candidatus Lokiarchaeota archaeon]
MKQRISICSDHIKKDFSLQDALEFCKSNNYLIEIHQKHFDELFALNKFDSIIAIHPHWRNYSLSTDDPSWFNRSIDYLTNLIEFVNKNGIKYMVIHPEGYPADLHKNNRANIVLKAFQKLSSELNKYASCKLLIENIPPASIFPPSDLPDYYIGERLEDMVPILEINPKFEFIFDLGHFLCSLNKYGNKELEMLDNLTQKLTYIHVHDNNGEINDHSPLEREKSIQILRNIEEKSNPIYSFEMIPTISGLKNSIKIIKGIMNE